MEEREVEDETDAGCCFLFILWVDMGKMGIILVMSYPYPYLDG